jgi:hypothetical protein
MERRLPRAARAVPQIWIMHAVFVVTATFVACGSDSLPAIPSPPPAGTDLDAGAAPPADPGAVGDGGTGKESGNDGSAADASDAASAGPAFVSLAERCKLINDRNLDDQSANQPAFHANLRGTDLGIPVANGTDLFFFFGDSAGSRGIWPLGSESLPDAVGYSAVSHAAVAADPGALCTSLRFLAAGAAQTGIGHGLDSRIERDFAGASMTPPAGHALTEYIHNPAGPHGANAFPNLPGDFEVPSGAFSHQGSIYVFYTTVVSPSTVEMKGSYLARWTTPSTTGVPSYDILYTVDERFDAAGAMHGDFINVAPVVHGSYVYLYGTGAYRQSAVHLARKPLAMLATPDGFERYDATTKTWVPANVATAAPVVVSSGIGELSVQYFPAINRFAMLDQEIVAGNNQVLARFATSPEGPWSAAITVASLSDAAFNAKYCCVSLDCTGQRLINCDRAGFYGTYMLPDLTTKPDGSFAIDFFMSTWDPYNVALMTATFH